MTADPAVRRLQRVTRRTSDRGNARHRAIDEAIAELRAQIAELRARVDQAAAAHAAHAAQPSGKAHK